jgi:tetratricopeptide (TPR) repeat protein
MGVVYQARQKGLNRLVALKMILTEQAGEEERARFRLEAEAAAALRHPNIVQIYEVGETEGRPFFSLEYIAGGSLAKKLAATPLPGDQAARLVEILARAMHVAHQGGIIHRDLKPGNILLQAKSETPSLLAEEEAKAAGSSLAFRISDFEPKITDFGLAKRLDLEVGRTQTGAILGTPSYMAPEQAGGQSKVIGPAADIYALGAILYEVLTGRPPFKAASPLDTLLQVMSVEPVPPRRFQPQVPRDLETICLKCLEKDARQRYASAEELAEDLAYFLRREPIHARPTPAWERGLKWSKRRPALTALLAVSALAILGMLGVWAGFTHQLREERDYARRGWQQAEQNAIEAGEQRQAAVQHRLHAEENFQYAWKVVEDYTTSVAEDPRLRAHDLERLRRQLLQLAVDFYQKFAQQRGTDDDVQAERARAYMRLACLTQEVASKSQAVEVFQKAIPIFQGLAGKYPAEPNYAADLASAYHNIGVLHWETGQFDQSQTFLQKALDLRKQLAAQERHPQFRAAVANTYDNLGKLFWVSGKIDLSIDAHRHALEVEEALMKEFPGDPDYPYLVASSKNNLALLFQDKGQPDQAETDYKAARTLFEKLTRDYPDQTDYQSDLSQCLNNLGCLYDATGRLEQAEKTYRQALGICQQLTETHASISQFAIRLGGLNCNLAHLVRRQGRLEESLTFYANAARTLEGVLRQEPRYAEARQFLDNTEEGWAAALLALGRFAEAIPKWDRAIELTDGPKREALRFARAGTLARSSEYLRAVKEAEAISGNAPTQPGDLYNLACVYAQASAAAVQDKKQSEANRDRQANDLAARAVQLLVQARAAGYFKNPGLIDHLNADEDLSALRKRDDFKKLCADLAKERKP